MFYAAQLVSRDGPLQILWVAATLDRRLERSAVESTAIGRVVERYLDPGAPGGVFAAGPAEAAGGKRGKGSHKAEESAPLALRLSGQLLVGVCRIYSRKVSYLLQDAEVMVVRLHRLNPKLVPLAHGEREEEGEGEQVELSVGHHDDADAAGPSEPAAPKSARGAKKRAAAAAAVAAAAEAAAGALGPDGQARMLPYDEEEILLAGTLGDAASGGLADLMGAASGQLLAEPVTPGAGLGSLMGAAAAGPRDWGGGGLDDEEGHFATFDDEMPAEFEFDLMESELEALRTGSLGAEALPKPRREQPDEEPTQTETQATETQTQTQDETQTQTQTQTDEGMELFDEGPGSLSELRGAAAEAEDEGEESEDLVLPVEMDPLTPAAEPDSQAHTQPQPDQTQLGSQAETQTHSRQDGASPGDDPMDQGAEEREGAGAGGEPVTPIKAAKAAGEGGGGCSLDLTADATAAALGGVGTEEYDNDGPATLPAADPNELGAAHAAPATDDAAGPSGAGAGGAEPAAEAGPDAGSSRGKKGRTGPEPEPEPDTPAAAARARSRARAAEAAAVMAAGEAAASPPKTPSGAAAAATGPAAAPGTPKTAARGKAKAVEGAGVERARAHHPARSPANVAMDADVSGRPNTIVLARNMAAWLKDRTGLIDERRRSTSRHAAASGAVTAPTGSPWLQVWSREALGTAPASTTSAFRAGFSAAGVRGGLTGAVGATAASLNVLAAASGPASLPPGALEGSLQRLFSFLAGRGGGAGAADGEGDATQAPPAKKRARTAAKTAQAAAAAAAAAAEEGAAGGSAVAAEGAEAEAAGAEPARSNRSGSRARSEGPTASAAAGRKAPSTGGRADSREGGAGPEPDDDGVVSSAEASASEVALPHAAGSLPDDADGTQGGAASVDWGPVDGAAAAGIDGEQAEAGAEQEARGEGGQDEVMEDPHSLEQEDGEEEDEDEEETQEGEEEATWDDEAADEEGGEPAPDGSRRRKPAADGFTARTQFLLRKLQMLAVSARSQAAREERKGRRTKKRRVEADEGAAAAAAGADGPLRVTTATQLLMAVADTADPVAACRRASLATAAGSLPGLSALGASTPASSKAPSIATPFAAAASSAASASAGNDPLAAKVSRMAAARTFYDLLVLSNRGYIALAVAPQPPGAASQGAGTAGTAGREPSTPQTAGTAGKAAGAGPSAAKGPHADAEAEAGLLSPGLPLACAEGELGELLVLARQRLVEQPQQPEGGPTAPSGRQQAGPQAPVSLAGLGPRIRPEGSQPQAQAQPLVAQGRARPPLASAAKARAEAGSGAGVRAGVAAPGQRTPQPANGRRSGA
ncbi:hypothetical protein HYH03_003648 [Edaphochlamys debaryana]|uniref:Rad21/Rec8-like protein N-terminal domain-containing protein n=1 Tax=Edaphochlamys debaryana TaxID=47281 RepID=A0A835YAZ9_9CHLO|nr:hypothetical protein HYH03_003648 [Edaphochlamys debaryana]|eukprot:KAG2498389.1 hypothetical protein HYH03_003648 [Edaphochlamys debaryana]